MTATVARPRRDRRSSQSKGTHDMYTDFSFGKLLRHHDSAEAITRPAGSPTEEHMRAVCEGYIANLNAPDPAYAENYFAVPRSVEDPLGTKPITLQGGVGGQDQLDAMDELLDVPFTPLRAEQTAPVSLSLGNKAALPFKLWAEVDGRTLTIDIVDVFTFDEDGRICDQWAFWGVENVTFLD
jgi:steroid delta-isomerase